MNDLISVNVTTFNRADLLGKCIESIINQSFTKCEIIIVDDGSTDNTFEIVQKYKEKDKRIRYIRHSQNKGNAAARNTAWRNSSAFYIAFMDDDDIWIDNTKLEKQIKIFKQYKARNFGIICSSVIIKKREKNIIRIINQPKNLKIKLLKGNGIIFSPTVLTTKEVLRRTDGFDENLFRGVDAEFFRNAVCVHGYDVFFMKDITTCINRENLPRMTNFSSSVEKTIKSLESYQYIYYKYEKHIKKHRDVNAYWLEIISKHYFYMFLLTSKKEYLCKSIHLLHYSMRCKVRKKSLQFIAKIIIMLTMKSKHL